MAPGVGDTRGLLAVLLGWGDDVSDGRGGRGEHGGRGDHAYVRHAYTLV